MSNDTCGARRPGWSNGPAIGRRRLPCTREVGHEGEHANALRDTWVDTAPSENPHSDANRDAASPTRGRTPGCGNVAQVRLEAYRPEGRARGELRWVYMACYHCADRVVALYAPHLQVYSSAPTTPRPCGDVVTYAAHT